MTDAKQQMIDAHSSGIIDTLAANPKAQSLVAGATVTVSTGGQWIEQLQNVFGLLGTILGCILSAVLIYKNVKDVKKG